MSGQTTWIILGVLVTALVIFFIYAAVKDSISKKKINKSKRIFIEEAKEFHKKTTLIVNEIIKCNDKYLAEFTVSVGEYKMGELCQTTKEIFEQTRLSDPFIKFFKKNPDYSDFVKNYVNLELSNSNLWIKRTTKSYRYFIDLLSQMGDINSDHKYDADLQEIRNYYENKLLKKSEPTE
ncbi:MHJ_0274 family protein [Mycoplasma crocodyli]|uniref:Uncharacterized protein n=1 Tax=Mycoplasma crocodyli (strain ATCC 51981 / MP145) TaxID=512564 RepID=D5E5C2_MYCCM|nr:hypothetical protein [Mycoplasma crocodyli]ADE19835.1 conserved hypothetical protein [Mycoplasma crocodyli MP145]